MGNAKEIEKLVYKIFLKHGMSSNHSKISAKAIINAELIGAASHGLARLKMYCDRINKKLINPRPKIKIKKSPHLFLMWMQIIVLDLLLVKLELNKQ